MTLDRAGIRRAIQPGLESVRRLTSKACRQLLEFNE
jgi:hypothetical protein